MGVVQMVNPSVVLEAAIIHEPQSVVVQLELIVPERMNALRMVVVPKAKYAAVQEVAMTLRLLSAVGHQGGIAY